MMTSSHEKNVDNLDALFTTMSTSTGVGTVGVVGGDSKQNSNVISGQSVDWASYLLNVLFQIGKEQQQQQQPIHGRHLHATLSSSISSLEALISQLHLPVGWPYTDPGYHLATQLLTDSSLFRMVINNLYFSLYIFYNLVKAKRN